MERKRNRATTAGLILVAVLSLGVFSGWSLISQWNRAAQALEDIPIPPEQAVCDLEESLVSLVDRDGGKPTLAAIFRPGFTARKILFCGDPPIETIVTLHYYYTENGQWLFDHMNVTLARPEGDQAREE